MSARPHTPRFRGLFVLFMILVVAPSLAISGFGIMAILDARTIAEARLKQTWTDRLARVRQEVAARVPADPGLTPAQRAEAVRQWIPEVAARQFNPQSAMVDLVTDVDAAPDSATRMRRTLDDLAGGRTEPGTLFRADVITSLPMLAPLEGYQLRVRMVGDDLLAREVRITSTIYVLLLLVFYVLLILGIVLVSTRMYREVTLSRMKTDFVSHVSHELRTPLTSIRMFLETLLMGRALSATEQRECLELCAQETERLSGLIERVLDWARLEAGKKSYRKVAATAGDVVDRALRSFRMQHMEAPYTLTTDLSAADAPVVVDVDAVADALLNLLHNAFKYTGVDKRIALSVVRSGPRVLIRVSDNGIGIARREQKKIFERFYRAEDLLSSGAQGSGLGLPLARRMVEAHGGRITVRSRKGFGSEFTLALPVATPKQLAQASPVTDAPPTTSAQGMTAPGGRA
jgi:two-component system phosphate regulon sensor histidine kinase PhoR